MPKSRIDLGHIIALLHLEVAKCGSQKEAARRLGVSPAYLNDVLQYRREPGAKILKALGYQREVWYVRIGK